MSQTYAVMGLDKSGLATVQYLVAKGCRVLAWDDNPAQRERAKAAGAEITDLARGGIEAELVLTPGITTRHQVAQQFKSIISDIEIFARDNPNARIVGITGTNGKSTTTALIHHILSAAGIKAAIGGNFGTSPLALPAADVYVLELSSYQLERCPSLRVAVGVMLNLTPDHLDRHGDMQGYADAKAKLFANARTDAVAVFNEDDSWAVQLGERAVENGFSASRISTKQEGGLFAATAKDGQLRMMGNVVLDLKTVSTLPGEHNWQNAAAAFAACYALDMTAEDIVAGIKTFPGLAHRQQLVAQQNGLIFVNDSKATNADATAKALGCYENIYWIIGGRAKAGGLDGLESYMPRIRKAFVIGEAAEDFGQWLVKNNVAYEQCGELKIATAKATLLAQQEKLGHAVILLSPACASLDQFKGFEERGTMFMEQVHNLLKEKCA